MVDIFITYSVLPFQTKLESDQILASVGKKPPQEIGIKVKNHSACGLPLAHNKSFRKLLKEIIGESAPRLTELNPKEFAGFQVGLLNKVGCALERSGSAHFAWYMCCLKRWPIWRVLLVLLLLLLIVGQSSERIRKGEVIHQ